jgi:molecular chaperone DnaK (HSP70)
MSIAFGIDFGTTNSYLAASYDGEVRLIDVEEYLEGENGINPKLIRSVLYFDDERRVFIGQKAIAHYIGDNTNRLGLYASLS